MIAASRGMALGALGAALLFHAALAAFLLHGEDVRIEGGAGASETRLGTSFADMVAGTQTALHTEERAERVRPAAPERAAAPPKPVAAERVTPRKAEPLAAPVPTAAAPRADVPDAPAAATSEAVPQAETIASPSDDSARVTRSLRPKRRPPEFEAMHTRAETEPKPAAEPAPRGNAAQDASAGTATGAAQADAPVSGADASAPQAAGNAASSNYPGLVMAHLARAPRPRMAARGTAVISFTVAATGNLADASIASSSGSRDLDSAALRMIQAAAPFPVPPPGAQRSFSISIKGR